MNFFKKLSAADSLVAFLILECLAITAFAIGGINIVFYVIGILLSIFTVFLVYNRFSKNEAKSLLLFMGLMLLISIFISFGNLLRNAFGATNVLVLLAINAFLFMGIALRRFKSFAPETILLTIGSALALLTLVSMIYSWTQYGFFYALQYKDTPIYFYNAELFNITKEGFWLQGFAFKETSIASTGVFGVLESCFLLGLFYVNPKNDKIKFSLFLVIGLIGLIYLITIPNLIALAFLVPVAFVGVIYRFLKGKKYTGRIVFYGILGIAALCFIFFIFAFINAKGGNAFSSFVASNRILNRIFNANGWMHNVNPILEGISKSTSQLFLGLDNSYANEEIIKTNSKMFEIEAIKEGGLLAFIFIIAFIVTCVFIIRSYLKRSNDSDSTKIIVLGILVSFFVYSTFNYDSFPLIHDSGNYISFFRSPLTLVMLALLGYVYTPILLKDGEEYGKEPSLTKEEVTKKAPVHDYDFGDDDL